MSPSTRLGIRYCMWGLAWFTVYILVLAALKVPVEGAADGAEMGLTSLMVLCGTDAGYRKGRESAWEKPRVEGLE